ncbi:Ig-like domain-containing protein [Flavobacterium hauense]
MSNFSTFKKTIAALFLLIVSNLTAQECAAPYGLAAVNTGMAHAKIYWAAPQSVPSPGYEWQLTLNGNTVVLQSGAATQPAGLLVTSLQTATAYTLKLRSHCSETSNSSWTELNFSTKTAFSISEGQIGEGENANPFFGAIYAPMMYAGIAQRNGSVSNMLFTQAEMQSINIPIGANITGVAFNKINAAYGGDAYPDLRFRMFAKNSVAQAPLDITTTYASIMTSHTEVIDNPAYDLPATVGWIDFNFETPIAYTGNGLELATAMYQNGQTAQFSAFISWQFTSGFSDYVIGAWPINTVPMSGNLTLNHNNGTGSYKERPNIKIFYEISNTVTGIDVLPYNSPATITQNHGTLQLVAPITPQHVSQEKTWQIISGSQYATLNANGIVTAVANGTIVVQATAADNATITDTLEITISGQLPQATGLEITVAGNAPATITTDDGTLQLIATVLPSGANQNVVWSTISGNAFAYTTQDGVVHAINNGTATIQAVSTEDNMILDTIEVTILGQVVPAVSLEITVAGNAAATITTDDGTLQLVATILPSNANQNVVWSTISGNAFAYMTQDGVVHAINNGTATIQAVSTENNTILDTIEVTISGQVVPAASLEITVAGNAAATITTDDGTLQLVATILPSNANQNVVWSTISGNAFAYMTQDGVVHAINNGTATIQAISTENNTILDTIEVTISGQVVAVSGIVITVENNADPIITTNGGTLQLIATATPSNANQNVVWSTISGNAFAYITQDGVVHAINNGTATIQAVSTENATILDTIEVTVTGQVLGLDEFNKDEVIIYPNPAQTVITIQSQYDISDVEIYTLEGKKVLESTGNSIDIAMLPQSNYILIAKSTDGKITSKKIVKN